MESGSAVCIDHGKRAAWVSQLERDAELIAPVATHGGDVVYAPVSSPGEVRWDFGNSLQPPKHVVLPQTDPIVSIRRERGHHRVMPIVDDRRRILLNLRSCDAKAMAFLRKVHEQDLPDDAYLTRAANVLLVVLTCSKPGPDCFCSCTNSGPRLSDGYDVQLTDLGDQMLAEAGSEDGLALIEHARRLGRPARAEDFAQREAVEARARSRFGAATCHVGSAMRRVSTRRTPEQFWNQVADECLGCGACNLICPTCYCFSVKDRRQETGWTRCRIWDSCQYPAFTLEASGHNPRQRQASRVRRRFFHKLSAQYYVRDGMVGCVGCGRCVKVCFGGAAMPTVVGAIRAGSWHE